MLLNSQRAKAVVKSTKMDQKRNSVKGGSRRLINLMKTFNCSTSRILFGKQDETLNKSLCAQRVKHSTFDRRGCSTSKGLRARRIRRMAAMPEYTGASGRHDHATFWERADESVRCSGFWAKLLYADRPTGLRPASQ